MRRVVLLMVALLASCGWALGQQRTVTGVVTSAADGSTLPSVTVQIKGTLTGVATDLDGRYSITVPGPETVLKFSYAGMEPQEIQVGNQSTINVALREKVEEIEQVVVTGYGKTSKAAFTGSAASVDDKALKSKVSANAIKALEGNIPGLQMTTGSGQPGAPATIFIRGRNSLNSGTQPLYVIDGIPFDAGGRGMRAGEGAAMSPLATLNPEDIESFTVLKDATATSIYGARAANGVIVITTKQGRQGSLNVNFTARIGAEMMPSFPHAYHLISSKELLEVVDEAALRNRRWKRLFDMYGIPSSTDEEYRDAVRYEVIGIPEDAENVNVNWLDEVTRTGLVQEYSLSISGGGASESSVRHFFSMDYLNNQALIVGKDMTRYSFRYNMNQRPVHFLRYGVNFNAAQTEINMGASGGYFSDPITQAYMIAPWHPVKDKFGEWNFGTNTNYNPVAMRSKLGDKNQSYQRRLIFSPYLEIYFLPELVFTSRFGGDFLLTDEFGYWSFLQPQGRDMRGMGENQNDVTQMLTWTNTLAYSKTFAKLHHIDAMLGYEAQSTYDKSAYLSGTNYAVDYLNDVALTSVPSSASTARDELGLQSIFATFQYDFAKRYFFSASLRFDGSSRFHKDHYWAPFWSVGGKYRLTAENFMEPVSKWMDIMLRMSYGTSGNQVVGSGWHPYQDLYSLTYGYNKRPGSRHVQFANRDLTWERTEKFNVGMDLSLFWRLHISMDWYYHLTNDMVFDVPISRTTGISTVSQNVGQLSNKGFEFTIKADAIKTEDWLWTITLVGSHNKNKVKKLSTSGPIEGAFTIIDEGLDIYTFKMKEYAGADPETGSPVWFDEDGYGTLNYNNAPKKIMGSASPKFQGSFTSDLSWKGIDLSFQFTTSLGGMIYGNNLRYDEHTGESMGDAMTYWVYENRWQKPGDITKVPRAEVWPGWQANLHSSRYLMKANYLKFKTLTLGYTFPKELVSKAYMKGLRVYITAENIYTFTSSKYRGFDPAGVGANGSQWWNYPMPRTVIGGINVTF